jgi:hypothetical protein
MTDQTALTPATPPAKPPADVQSILNSAILIVGPSQSGKSSLLVTLAEYIWEIARMVTLYYLIDGGGIPPQGEALVRHGIIRLWRVRTRSSQGLTFETLDGVSKGYWPARINPKTGETDPNVTLVPPVTESYAQYCGAGHLIKTVPLQSLLIPTMCLACKRIIGPGEWKIVPTVKRTRGFENVGGMAIDGLSSSGTWLMEDLSRRLDLGGEKGAMGPVVSGNMVFGTNNRAHYGSAQSRLNQMVLNALGIPGLVVPPVYTALVEEASESGGLMVKAPVIPGSAKSSEVTQWFGDTIGTRIEERDGKRYRQMRLASWYEPTPSGPVRHLCGVRSYPGRMPILIEEEEAPQGRPELAFQTFNLGYYLRLRKAAGEAIEAEYAQKYQDAPGVPDGIVEYGEPLMEVAAQPQAGQVGGPLPGTPAPAPASVGPTGMAPVAPAPVVQVAGVPGAAPMPKRRGAPAAPPPPPLTVQVAPPAQVGEPATVAPGPTTGSTPGAPEVPPVPPSAPAQVPPPAPPAPAVVAAAPGVVQPASAVVSGPAPNPIPPAASPKKAVVVPPPPGRRPQP